MLNAEITSAAQISIGAEGWDYLLFIYSGGDRDFDFLKLNLTLKVRVIHSQNNRDLNQGVLHFWSKFDDPSLNRWPVMVQQAQNGINWIWKVKVNCFPKQ